MDMDKSECVGCGNCHVVCPMGAISLDADGKSVVNTKAISCNYDTFKWRPPPYGAVTSNIFMLGEADKAPACVV